MTITHGPKYFWTSLGDQQGENRGSVFEQSNIPSDAYYLPDPPGPVSSWLWDHGAKEWIEAPVVAPEPVQLTPITRRQLRLTLVRRDISLASIEALIEAMPEGLTKQEAQIEWADAQTFSRDHPTLLLIAQALELTPADVDEMWLEAMVA